MKKRIPLDISLVVNMRTQVRKQMTQNSLDVGWWKIRLISETSTYFLFIKMYHYSTDF